MIPVNMQYDFCQYKYVLYHKTIFLKLLASNNYFHLS